MRSRRPATWARTWFVCRRLRFRLVAFLVRMWLLLAWPHLYLPEAVFRKRLAAARLVLILGIGVSVRNLSLARAVAVHHAFRPALAGRKPLIRHGSRRVLVPHETSPSEPEPRIMPPRVPRCNAFPERNQDLRRGVAPCAE